MKRMKIVDALARALAPAARPPSGDEEHCRLTDVVI
jgi:hypothetical protein